MKGTIILILSIVAASVTLVLVAGFVITPKDDRAPTLVNDTKGGERMIVGSISFDFPAGFAVASRSGQLPTSSGIPVCDLGFDYCFYDMGGLSSTSDQKMGLRINTKTAQDEGSCVNTASLRNESLRPEVIRRNGYSASFIGPIELISGEERSYGYIYRVFEEGSCYEAETRLVWPALQDEKTKSSLAKLNPIINSISILSSGERIFFSR
jgi:hypothetical protein